MSRGHNKFGRTADKRYTLDIWELPLADIFISYASEDRERARTLAMALEAKSWSVWWDKKIIAGQAFDQAIEHEIGAAKSVVVLWSVDSVSSEWVKNEAAAAAEQGKLVPALIDDVKLPLEFRRRQTVNLVDWSGDPSHEGFKSLCDGISTTITGTAPHLSVTPPPPGLRWTRAWTLAAIAALAFALLFGAYRAGLFQDHQSTPVSQLADSVSGIWHHQSGVIWVIKAVGNSAFSIEQMDTEKGLTMSGTGVLKNNKLEITYVLGPERVRGTGLFKLSADGQQLSGEYKNEGGDTRSLVFRR